MTDNLPAIYNERSRATDSWTEVVDRVAALASNIAGTEFVPATLRGKPAAVAAAILYGREVGLPPMTALTQTHVVEGRPGLSAKAQRALILAAGHEIEFVETSSARCVVRGRRRFEEEWLTVTWTIDDARAAGLLKPNSGWQKYPRRMLQARASAELADMKFPDVVGGFESVESLVDDTEADDVPTATTSTTTVRRRARKGAQSALTASAKQINAETGAETPDNGAAPSVPLPGEPGYEDTPPHGPGEGEDVASDPQGEGGKDATSKPETETTERAPTETTTPHEPSESDEGFDVTRADEPAPDEPPVAPPASISRAQLRMLHARLSELGADDRPKRLYACGRIIGRTLESTNDMSKDDASAVIDTLSRFETDTDLRTFLETLPDPS